MEKMKSGQKVKNRWPNKIADIISVPTVQRQKVIKMAQTVGVSIGAANDWITGRSFPRNPVVLGAVMAFLSNEAGVKLNPQDVWLDFDPTGGEE